MHSFWTLFKAEFAAESLVLLLFGGKFPRFLALFLLILVGSWYVFRGLFRISYRLLVWIFVTEGRKVEQKLKKVIRIGKPFGDTALKIRFENGRWILRISNPQFRMGITTIEFQVARKTGQLRIFALHDRAEPVEFTYIWLQRLIPYDRPIMMHVDYAAYIYSQLRNNFL